MLSYINLDLVLGVVRNHGKFLTRKMMWYTFYIEKLNFPLKNRLKKGKRDQTGLWHSQKTAGTLPWNFLYLVFSGKVNPHKLLGLCYKVVREMSRREMWPNMHSPSCSGICSQLMDGGPDDKKLTKSSFYRRLEGAERCQVDNSEAKLRDLSFPIHPKTNFTSIHEIRKSGFEWEVSIWGYRQNMVGGV